MAEQSERGGWRPKPRPEWVSTVNREGVCLDLPTVVPLAAKELLDTARTVTGLEDFGDDDDWREAFAVLLDALRREARLTLLGRLITRSELLLWLCNRLRLTELWRRHPEILQQPLEAPLFVVGLPRSGTSILFELLSQDARFRSPEIWEALFPCPPTEKTPPADDLRLGRADGMISQWGRIAPEFNTMHEMGARTPCECVLLMASTFISDHIASLYQVPSYHAWMAAADMAPVYAWHRRYLQTLQWGRRNQGTQRWLLKAPEHLSFLPQLFATYPDARVIQTHRDPLKCMASTTDLLGTLYWMRSDQFFESSAFEDLIFGQATAARLEKVMHQRRNGTIPESHFFDTHHQDLMQDPVASLRRIYDFLNMDFTDQNATPILDYLKQKSQNTYGAHQYALPSPKRIARERPLFQNYQTHHKVPNEL